MKKYLSLLLLLTLVSCLYYDREKIVDKHRLAGYDYRLFQSTPAWDLAKAVQDGDVAKIREIRNSNPELINYQESKYGETLLMLTIFNRNYKSFQALLDNGADVNIYDKFNGSSAIIKASRNDVKYVKLLVEYGANVNDIQVGKRRPDCSVRWTPLIAASRAGNFEVVKYLVENGADINYHNEDNWEKNRNKAEKRAQSEDKFISIFDMFFIQSKRAGQKKLTKELINWPTPHHTDDKTIVAIERR